MNIWDENVNFERLKKKQFKDEVTKYTEFLGSEGFLPGISLKMQDGTKMAIEADEEQKKKIEK